MKGLLLALASSAALVLPAGASASVPPTLVSVSQQNRHPSATFSMPGADSATIYFASKPELASDGGFLQENIKDTDFLTTDEISAVRGHTNPS